MSLSGCRRSCSHPSADELGTVTGLTDQVAVDALGSPETDRVTLPVKPTTRLRATLNCAIPPRVTITVAGVAEMVKSRAVTASVTVKLCVIVPEVPVTAIW